MNNVHNKCIFILANSAIVLCEFLLDNFQYQQT